MPQVLTRPEPVAANMNNYPVLVKTPEGGFINVPWRAAVAGPGFEAEIESRKLTRVGNSYSGGPVVYTTPEHFQVRQQVKATPVVVEAAPLPEVPVAVVVQAPSVDLTPNRDGTFRVPDHRMLAKMTKVQLAELARMLKLSSEGSRAQLLSRVSPLAESTVAV